MIHSRFVFYDLAMSKYEFIAVSIFIAGIIVVVVDPIFIFTHGTNTDKTPSQVIPFLDGNQKNEFADYYQMVVEWWNDERKSMLVVAVAFKAIAVIALILRQESNT